MVMTKAFPSDKNYLLLSAQERLRSTFVFDAHSIVKENYFKYHNPLGIVDATVRAIMDFIPGDESNCLSGLYDNLSIAYRYIHGNNQLEIVWDGRSHEELYADQWRTVYKDWLHELCSDPSFLKLFLVVTVFNSPEKNYKILENRLKGAVNTKFSIRIRKQKLFVA